MNPLFPTLIEIVFEQQKRKATQIEQIVVDAIVVHYQHTPIRQSTLEMIQNNLEAITSYKATDFHPSCMQNIVVIYKKVML